MKRGGFGVALAVMALSLVVPRVSKASCGTPTYFYPPDFGSQPVGTVGPTLGASYPVDQFYGLGLGSSDPNVVTTVNVTISGNNPGDWLILQNQCDGALPAGAGCGFDLAFAPTALGPRSAIVTLYANGCPIFVWPVTGTGTAGGTGTSIAPPTTPGQTVPVPPMSNARRLEIGFFGSQSCVDSHGLLGGSIYVLNTCTEQSSFKELGPGPVSPSGFAAALFAACEAVGLRPNMVSSNVVDIPNGQDHYYDFYNVGSLGIGPMELGYKYTRCDGVVSLHQYYPHGDLGQAGRCR